MDDPDYYENKRLELWGQVNVGVEMHYVAVFILISLYFIFVIHVFAQPLELINFYNCRSNLILVRFYIIPHIYIAKF